MLLLKIALIVGVILLMVVGTIILIWCRENPGKANEMGVFLPEN